MKRVGVTIVAAGKNQNYKYRVCVPYLSDMQCPYAALYFHLWPVWFYQLFLHYVLNDTNLGKSY